MDENTVTRLTGFLRGEASEMEAYLGRLVAAESPSAVPAAQNEVLSILASSFQDLGLGVRRIPGESSGGHLLASATGQSGSPGEQGQLLLGHCDTVWPLGTLETMPFAVERDIIKGPGVFDMKGGLTQMVFALRAIQELGLEPALPVTVFVNSDEEIGSDESEPHIVALAKRVRRVFVLEPALGVEGRLKTARKGVGRFKVTTTGRAAHAGLDPGSGVSAILEMSYVIQALHDLNEPEQGISVSVGVVEGGLGSNVIPPLCTALVDARVAAAADAPRVEASVRGLSPTVPGTSIQVQGGIDRPPLERTERNQRLWRLAKEMGRRAGLTLEQGMAGGGSDGNTTSQYAATLDGLGSVGDGAHASHEFIFRSRLAERTLLLALLLLVPEASGAA